MGDLRHYVLRGGIEGRERLRMLSRIMHKSTTLLFDRPGVTDGLVCLDAGCGGGDVTLEIARRVGPSGKVVGADVDTTKIDLACQEAAQLGIANIEFRLFDIREHEPKAEFDMVYARFLLTHLPEPAAAVSAFRGSLKPGGLLIVEDIDCSGAFNYPESSGCSRYYELYCEAVRKRGGDPNIGPRLPLLLKDGGFARVGVGVTQEMGLEGEMKLINAITMENIADSVVQAELATREEVTGLIRELYDFAADPRTLTGTPRIIQTWGWRPAR